jgi:hypothetical protein
MMHNANAHTYDDSTAHNLAERDVMDGLQGDTDRPKLFDGRETAAWLRMTPGALRARRRKGTGPTVYETNPVRYAALDVHEWAQKTKRW